MINVDEGKEMYELMKRLFPICRSITGDGVRKTLRILQEHIPITIVEVPTGTQVFDWEIPNEWNILDAYVMDEYGTKVIDFKENNLHVMGYSVPVNQEMSLDELQEYLYSLKKQPDAIPYITSYYKERWGFCLAHTERQRLKDGMYKVYINSELKPGSLTYGELIIPGETEEEIFLSTYICHPSMANNELSGPVLAVALAKWLLARKNKYTYRIVFIPETIGSLTYLSRNLEHMKKNIVAGFNLTCVGDDRTYSYLPSRQGNTLADKVAINVLKNHFPEFVEYTYLDRGSDERQYCSPGIDLPVASLMRTKYGQYTEYHTSLDNLDLVTQDGLQGSFTLYKDCLELLEWNEYYQIACLGEPQLGKRGLYPTLSTKESGSMVREMMNFIAYADGSNDLVDISNIIDAPAKRLIPIVEKLIENNLLLVNRGEKE
ncbi:DUF4910 domain-containing protein [Sporosarcina sp. PTS2304]|uniref:DUF4910 domain-containing protein n=1 Tax=Sporosarcina sp. PTS2304 TaxID=2283194 RepID=UPI000E0DAC74|nr:DUF4910 domain-containing protein [Sporosarcina sp. PTS2304]AXH98459.1 DUF4910 domain-containing protein [Sporosarcina sp. PTS2304]